MNNLYKKLVGISLAVSGLLSLNCLAVSNNEINSIPASTTKTEDSQNSNEDVAETGIVGQLAENATDVLKESTQEIVKSQKDQAEDLKEKINDFIDNADKKVEELTQKQEKASEQNEKIDELKEKENKLDEQKRILEKQEQLSKKIEDFSKKHDKAMEELRTDLKNVLAATNEKDSKTE